MQNIGKRRTRCGRVAVSAKLTLIRVQLEHVVIHFDRYALEAPLVDRLYLKHT